MSIFTHLYPLHVISTAGGQHLSAKPARLWSDSLNGAASLRCGEPRLDRLHASAIVAECMMSNDNSMLFLFLLLLILFSPHSLNNVAFTPVFLMRSLLQVLSHHRVSQSVVTVVTQTRVDKNDAAFDSPSKPVGRFYSAEEAEEMRKKG